MTKLEQLARAIWKWENEAQGCDGVETGFRWDHGSNAANYRKMARAFIEAMREPTVDMCRAYGPDFLDNGAVWQAMIDAILAEKP